MTRDPLLEACLAAPDDDGPRLVLADAIGGERGEFIVVQCALARGGLSPERSGALRRRQRELIAANGVAWSGLTGLAKRVTFRRGFVDAVELDADVLLARSDELFTTAFLVRNALLTGMVIERLQGRPDLPDDRSPLWMLPATFALPAMARLVGLHLDPIGIAWTDPDEEDLSDWDSREDRAIELAIESGVLANLTSFGAGGLRRATIDKLIAAGAFTRIERLCLGSHESAFNAALAHAPEIRAVTARSASIDATVSTSGALHCGLDSLEIPATVVELEVQGDLAVLPALPLAAQLERLVVGLHQIHHEPTRLAACVRLRSLHLTDHRDWSGHSGALADAFASLSLPALRELRASGLGVPIVFAIAKTFGPQLELLDLRGSAAELHHRRGELQALVAGDVCTGIFEEPRALAFLGGPPLDVPLVELPR